MVKRFGSLDGIIRGLLKIFEELAEVNSEKCPETKELEIFQSPTNSEHAFKIELQLVEEKEHLPSLFEMLGGPMFNF